MVKDVSVRGLTLPITDKEFDPTLFMADDLVITVS